MTTRCPYPAADLATPEIIADPYPAYVAPRPHSPCFGHADDDRFLATSRRWSTALMLSGPVSAAEQQAAFGAMVANFSGVIAAHELSLASAQGDTIIDALHTTTVDGQGFTSDEILTFCLAHIVSGVDTPMYLLGNALAILAAQPDLFCTPAQR